MKEQYWRWRSKSKTFIRLMLDTTVCFKTFMHWIHWSHRRERVEQTHQIWKTLSDKVVLHMALWISGSAFPQHCHRKALVWTTEGETQHLFWHVSRDTPLTSYERTSRAFKKLKDTVEREGVRNFKPSSDCSVCMAEVIACLGKHT